MGWLFLDELLTRSQLAGILITVSGIIWVVLDRRGRQQSSAASPQRYLLGLIFGFLAATGQAAGLVTAKFGLTGDFPALSGTLIRMVAAALVLWVFAILQRQVRATVRRLQGNPRAFGQIAAGAFFGPTIGVTLSLVAVQRIPVGIAATLSSLPPIFLIPVAYFLLGERFGWSAIFGTLLAISGVAILFIL
jgi:drug/metabolite transporter (DMT)-like permease